MFAPANQQVTVSKVAHVQSGACKEDLKWGNHHSLKVSHRNILFGGSGFLTVGHLTESSFMQLLRQMTIKKDIKAKENVPIPLPKPCIVTDLIWERSSSRLINIPVKTTQKTKDEDGNKNATTALEHHLESSEMKELKGGQNGGSNSVLKMWGASWRRQLRAAVSSAVGYAASLCAVFHLSYNSVITFLRRLNYRLSFRNVLYQ